MEVSLDFVNILEINYILIRDVYVREASNMFTCQLCHFSFKWEKTLKRHMESTHRGKILTCKGCSRTFNRRDSFERHKRLMHKGHFMCGTTYLLE